MHAHTLPIAMPAFSAPAFTFAGSMCDGSSIGISTVSKPQSLNFLKSFTLSVTKGETKRNELMPKRMEVLVGVSRRADAHSVAQGEGSQAWELRLRDGSNLVGPRKARKTRKSPWAIL